MTEVNAPGENVVVSNGRQFRRTTWNGISVVQDVETGYYGTADPCKKYGKLFKDWRVNKKTQELLAIATKELKLPSDSNSKESLPRGIPLGSLIVEILDVSKDLRGSFIHPDLFHSFAEWNSPEYAFKVSHLMNLLNERNKLTHQTLEQTINGLNDELEKLKHELKPKAEKADAIDNLIDAFNSNHENKLENTSTLEANTITFRNERFIQTTWNGISVLKHERTGYYKASKACEDNGKLFADWYRLKTTKEYLEQVSTLLQIPIEVPDMGIPGAGNPGCLLYRIHAGGADVEASHASQGYYIHPDLFHDVCYWANKLYAFKVSHLMNLLNERNKLTHQTLEQTIENLQFENIGLKDKNESKNHSLNELEAELVSRAAKIDELESEIEDLTTPIDTRLAPPTAYAKPIGNDYFQLKQSASILGPNVPTLRRESFIGAIDCVRQTKKELKNRNLIVNVNGASAIARIHLDETFDLLHRFKERSNINIDERNDWLDRELESLRRLPSTAQREGKIFELEYIREHEELTPWALVPIDIKNKLNEMIKDTGIDAVVLNGNEITKIVQMKYKRVSQTDPKYNNLRANDLSSFISKAQQARYQSKAKTLVTKNCKLGPCLRKLLEANGISFEIY